MQMNAIFIQNENCRNNQLIFKIPVPRSVTMRCFVRLNPRKIYCNVIPVALGSALAPAHSRQAKLFYVFINLSNKLK